MVDEKYSALLLQAKYALLDLKEMLERSDHGSLAWRTVKELDKAIRNIDPDYESVLEFGAGTCDFCGGEANFDSSPEGQRCGVCDDWICNNCQDCSAGLGNKPFPEQDVEIGRAHV